MEGSAFKLNIRFKTGRMPIPQDLKQFLWSGFLTRLFDIKNFNSDILNFLIKLSNVNKLNLISDLSICLRKI